MCLGYKPTTDAALPVAGRVQAQASIFLATCRKRERWTDQIHPAGLSNQEQEAK